MGRWTGAFRTLAWLFLGPNAGASWAGGSGVFLGLESGHLGDSQSGGLPARVLGVAVLLGCRPPRSLGCRPTSTVTSGVATMLSALGSPAGLVVRGFTAGRLRVALAALLTGNVGRCVDGCWPGPWSPSLRVQAASGLRPRGGWWEAKCPWSGLLGGASAGMLGIAFRSDPVGSFVAA